MFPTTKVDVTFTKGAIKEISNHVVMANAKMEDIGARRLHTIMTILLEKYLYNLPDP